MGYSCFLIKAPYPFVYDKATIIPTFTLLCVFLTLFRNHFIINLVCDNVILSAFMCMNVIVNLL